MTHKIVYLSRRPEVLFEAECTVLETYCFDDDLTAAYVEFDGDTRTLDAPGVLGVEDLTTVEPLYEPGDVGEGVATIEDVRRLHDVPRRGATGEGVTVVAMDSGVDSSHPVFSDVRVEEVDVTGDGKGDDVGHGTAVMGQITRLAPGADLIALRIFGGEGSTKTNVILRAYEWLHNNTDRYEVVNMSWGAQEVTKQLDRVHNRLVEKGVRDVTAAGNTGEKAGSPGTAERAFSVGACTAEGKMAEFSSYNPDRDNPDVAAIGKDNRLAGAEGTSMGTDLDGPWVKASGTSFAAPEVAGMVAKLLDARGGLPPEQVMRAFEAGARNIPDQPKDGAGLADYRDTLWEAGGGSKPEPGPDEPGTPSERGESVVFSVGGRQVAVLAADCLDSGFYETTCEDDDGETVVRFASSNGGSGEGD
ncbi:S8 family peptidase [Halomarina litorea]|uniref:S8 family peptidase n=1 Tax=Halomarina litorea TaxID=2961595 RepID=UPI0020C402CA|nr:S8 family serine peptidase [Halomarina sp. BCD28]